MEETVGKSGLALVALLGAWAYVTLVAHRGEHQLRVYPHRRALHLRHRLPVLLEVDRAKVLMFNDRRATPFAR